MGPCHNRISLFNLYYILDLLCNQVHITSTAAAEFPAAGCVYVTYQPSLTLFNAKNSNCTGSAAKLQFYRQNPSVPNAFLIP